MDGILAVSGAVENGILEALAAPTDAASSVGAALSAALLACFAGACIAACVVDARTRHIPNGAVFALAGAALVQMLLCNAAGLPVLAALGAAGERVVWAVGVLGVGLGGELAWRRAHAGAHGMGFGDVKLAAACALWLGPGILVAMFVACLVAVPVALLRRRSTFPFGPYLVAAACACLAARLAALI